MPLTHTFALAAFPMLVVLAAMRDATTYTIPNWMSALGGCAFVPAAMVAGMAPATLGWSAALGLVALIAGVVMFARGWIGGGDAKLFAVCGVWIGWSAITHFLFWTALAGGGLAVALLIGRKLYPWLPRFTPGWIRRLLTPGENVPYGVAIAVGALVAFPHSPIVQAFGLTGPV